MNRLNKQLADCKKLYEITLDKQSLFMWQVIIKGKPQTPYDGGKFKLNIKFPQTYPFKFPQFTFSTKIFHPNIRADNGQICQDMIGAKQWVPTKKVEQVLEKIQGILMVPQLDHPINEQACKSVKDGNYFKIAAQWTKKHA